MKVKTRDSSPERRLIIGMIVDPLVLAAVAARWDMHGMFSSEWANTIGGWCVRHYKKYKKAPGHLIEPIFQQWAEVKRDKEVVGAVENILHSLSGQYEREKKQSQTDVLLDLAGSHFTRVKMQQTFEEAQAKIESGDVEGADALVKKYDKVDLGLGSMLDVLGDREALKRTYSQKVKPLVEFPGALGKFFGNTLARDAFVSFEGPEKRGKTWILMSVAWQAIRQGRKVAFFEVGDLSEGQALDRFYTRAARRPRDAGKFTFPTGIEPAGDAETTILAGTTEREYDTPLSEKQVAKALDKIVSRVGDGSLLKLSTHPARSLSMVGMRGVLEREAAKGWVPDVIVIDYADILAPISGAVDTRDQINATWIAMRALSMTNHCLVVTATQTDADSYNTALISMDNFTEDKRKRGHVTASIGINQGDEEKKNGIYRLNYIVRREHEFSRNQCVHVAGSLSLGNPFMYSTF